MNQASSDLGPFNGQEEGPAPRTLPYNIEAEKALLGAIITDNRAHESVSEFLLPEHFAIPEHGRIYDACCTLISREESANNVSLAPMFERIESLADIGGKEYLAELIGSAVTIINSGEYGKIIYEAHIRRELIHIGEEMVETAFSHDLEVSATDQIESVEHSLSELAGSSVSETAKSRADGVQSTLQVLEQRFIDPHKLSGLSSGIKTLDKLLMGLEDTNLIILAGRPSMGKTSLAQKIAKYSAFEHYKTGGEQGAPVAFFSLEMSTDELNMRFISDGSNTPLHTMRSGLYNQMTRSEEWQKVVQNAQELEQLPLFIDDTGALTTKAIRSRARRMKRKHGIGLIIIDQLTKIRPADPRSKKIEYLGQMTDDLKAMAKELEVPVVLLHQLSRAVEMRDDKRPQMSDLRDSGDIEQDADVVLFVYREEYYLERSEPVQLGNETPEKFAGRYGLWQDGMSRAKNKADIIVAKQRMGGIGRARAHFQGEFTRFANIAHNQDEML